jgi:hypothetical protein
MNHARPKLYRRVCRLRDARTAGGPSRLESQGCAADGTADTQKTVARGDTCSYVGVSANAHRLCRVLLTFLFELPSGDADRTGALTRARALHAARSSIRSDSDTSSLEERGIARADFFLFRWHRAHTCHTLNVMTSTSTDDGLVPRRIRPAQPIMGTCARLGSRWRRLPHAGLAGECALCAFLLCK